MTFFQFSTSIVGMRADGKFSSTVRPSRFVLAATLPDKARHFRRVERTQVSMEMRANGRNLLTRRAFPETSSFDVILPMKPLIKVRSASI